VLIALAAFGLIRQPRQPVVLMLAAIYTSFWLGQLYNVLLLFTAKGVATSMGWYMYTVVAAEVAISIIGLKALAPARLRDYVPFAGISLFVLLDIYTLHAVALPYYAGLIAHRPNGSIAALDATDMQRIGLGEILARLTAYKAGILSPWILLALWAGYVVATGGLLIVGMRCRTAEDHFCSEAIQ